MARKILSTMIMAVAATFVLASCGKEIPAEMTKSFDDAQSGVMKQLDEVKTKLTDQMNKCMDLMKDTTKKAQVDAIDAELKNDETQVGEIEKTLNDLKTEKDSLVAAHKATEFKALWDKAQTTYTELGTKIAAINTALDASAQKIQALNTGKPAAAATSAAGDSVSQAGTATSGTDAKIDEAKKDANAKVDAAKADAHAKTEEAKKAVHAKADEAEKKVPLIRPNTNPGEKEKTILHPNTNP